MFKQNKVLNPTYSKKTKHIVVRTTFWNYHGRLRWQSLTVELKTLKAIVETQSIYTPNIY